MPGLSAAHEGARRGGHAIPSGVDLKAPSMAAIPGVDLKAPSMAHPITLIALWCPRSATAEGSPFQAISGTKQRALDDR